MAVISNFPRGLVSLTGLNDLGQAPRELSAVIAPSIDITQFLLLNRESLAASASVTATGFAFAFIVPAGELWYVHSFTALSPAIAAGDRLRLSVGLSLQGGFFQQSESSPTINTAGDRVGCGIRAPIWIGPGTGIGTFIEAYTSTGGGFSMAYSAAISRLRI